MDDGLPAGASRPEDNLSLSELKEHAEDARRRQVWEAAIRLYRMAVNREPGDAALRTGLGQSYEGKSREKGGEPFLLMAYEQYREAVRLAPGSQEVHDSLLAASVRMGRLEDLQEDYRLRAARSPGDPVLRASLRKIETLVLLSARPTAEDAAPHRATWWILEAGLPIVSLTCFLASTIIRHQDGGPPRLIALILIRTSLFFLLLYIAYKIFRYWKDRG